MLKKDMVRDPDPRKVTAYIDPVCQVISSLFGQKLAVEKPQKLTDAFYITTYVSDWFLNR